MKMKKINLLLMTALLACLVCMPLNSAAEGAAHDNLLARIYLKNNPGEILKYHRSFTCAEVEEGDSAIYYIDAEVSVKDCSESHDYIRVRTPEFDYCHFAGDIFGRWISFESEPCVWEGLSTDMLSEEVLSVEEQDGLLTLTTQPSEAYRKRILEDEYADMEDREKIRLRVVYVLDADTLELKSVTDYDTLPDGDEVQTWGLRFDYDVDLPYGDEVSAIQAHLAEAGEYRTTTCVFDEGTAYEARYVFPTPIGDGCYLSMTISKDGIRYQIDAERTIPTNEAKDNDATLYLDRVDAQEAD